MWKGKNKAFTLSLDDGILQDERMIALLDKYGLKATFNLNAGLLGTKSEKRTPFGKFLYRQDKVEPSAVRSVYANHEVAGHSLVHPNLTQLEDSAVIYQVEADRRILSDLCGYEVVGFAYPCGGVNHDERVASLIREHTGIRYAKTNRCTYNLDFCRDNLFLFHPTLPIWNTEEIMDFGRKFIDSKAETPQLLFLIGHSFELDEGSNINWEKFEEFCRLISGREDIFYGTNKEVLLDR